MNGRRTVAHPSGTVAVALEVRPRSLPTTGSRPSLVLEVAVLATSRPPPCSAPAGARSPSRSTSPTACPGFSVVGLPDEVCRESRDRVRAALLSSGLAWPQRRITVNLAPSGMRKGGAGLDLPIAVGVLVASEVVPAGGHRGPGLRRRARPRRLGAARARHGAARRRAR